MQDNMKLNTIGRGRIEQIFNREKSKIMENIANQLTNPTKKRTMIIEIDFTPDISRQEIRIAVRGRSKTEFCKEITEIAFADTDQEGNAILVSNDPTQTTMLDDLEKKQETINQ